jgi:hypothetical protein
VATGIIGATGGSATAVAWIGLSTAAGVTGINLYERNFLFSENNVKAVEELTLKALGAARDAAISADRANAYDFPSAVSALMDIQGVCEVQNILDMVRKSINNAQPFATTGTGEIDAASTLFVRSRLGGQLIGNAMLSQDELKALYWLTMSPTRPSDEDRKVLAWRLRNLNPRPLNADGSENSFFFGNKMLLDQIRTIMAGLPASAIAQMESEIKPAAPPPPPGALGLPAAGAASGGGVVAAPRTLGRIRIDIR